MNLSKYAAALIVAAALAATGCVSVSATDSSKHGDKAMATVAPPFAGATLDKAADSVEFHFKPNASVLVTADGSGQWARLTEEIKTVHVAGDFNAWDKGAWEMKKDADGTWRLRKPLAELGKAMAQNYKFCINGMLWVEPYVPVAGSTETGMPGAGMNFLLNRKAE